MLKQCRSFEKWWFWCQFAYFRRWLSRCCQSDGNRSRTASRTRTSSSWSPRFSYRFTVVHLRRFVSCNIHVGADLAAFELTIKSVQYAIPQRSISRVLIFLPKGVSLVVILLLSVMHGQCDARPTVTFPACSGTRLILLGDRDTLVLTTCSWLHSTARRPGFEPATYWSQLQHIITLRPPELTIVCNSLQD